MPPGEGGITKSISIDFPIAFQITGPGNNFSFLSDKLHSQKTLTQVNLPGYLKAVKFYLVHCYLSLKDLGETDGSCVLQQHLRHL